MTDQGETSPPEHFDVVVVGAGLSGICAGYHLQASCPDRSYAILEARDAIGGTWDLFRYPGIRSDSDMYTLGFSFRPWMGEKAIADGPSILEYIRDTAREHRIDEKIRFGHKVVRAELSTKDARWTIHVERADGTRGVVTAGFLLACSGYYDYAAGYTPDFPGRERFAGRVVHPQAWGSDVEYEGKRVVVIGSGATAVTLVPELAKKAAHVTMLQRSPTYIMSLPAVDPIARFLQERLPDRAAYALTRWKNVGFGLAFYKFCRAFPRQATRMLLKGARAQLGDGVDVDTHFTPSYSPWEQRLCLVPDADLFRAVREGRAEVVTDHIETFTERGILLRSGRELEADLVVTATGLVLQLFGGASMAVDGKEIVPSEHFLYRGAMLEGVPNFALTIGYTNASWTLKCELACRYVCRILNRMAERGDTLCTPRLRDASMGEVPLIDFSSGYVQRALKDLPKQGEKTPWRLYQNFLFDTLSLRAGSVEDDVLEFRRA